VALAALPVCVFSFISSLLLAENRWITSQPGPIISNAPPKLA